MMGGKIMYEEILEAINEVSKKINSVNKEINDLYSLLHLKNETNINNCEDATCELSETTEESVAALEQAICDLSEEIFGGGE